MKRWDSLSATETATLVEEEDELGEGLDRVLAAVLPLGHDVAAHVLERRVLCDVAAAGADVDGAVDVDVARRLST